jgi:hypothetical protein
MPAPSAPRRACRWSRNCGDAESWFETIPVPAAAARQMDRKLTGRSGVVVADAAGATAATEARRGGTPKSQGAWRRRRSSKGAHSVPLGRCVQSFRGSSIDSEQRLDLSWVENVPELDVMASRAVLRPNSPAPSVKQATLTSEPRGCGRVQGMRRHPAAHHSPLRKRDHRGPTPGRPDPEADFLTHSTRGRQCCAVLFRAVPCRAVPCSASQVGRGKKCHHHRERTSQRASQDDSEPDRAATMNRTGARGSWW